MLFFGYSDRLRTSTRFGGGLKITCYLVCMLQNGTMDKNLKRRVFSPTRKCLLSVFLAYDNHESNQVSKTKTCD